jgi:hypothetical protein
MNPLSAAMKALQNMVGLGGPDLSQDIELPHESRRTDPRLPAPPDWAAVGNGIRGGIQILRDRGMIGGK